jgi:hypothetical protein
VHENRRGKFSARLVSYPELGGHVLTPEFDRAQWQRPVSKNRQNQEGREASLGGIIMRIVISWSHGSES